MWAKRILTLVLGAFVLASGAGVASSVSAAPGDGTEDVAEVQAGNLVLLNPDGTLTVSVRVRCDPGWVPVDVNTVVAQGTSTYAEGFTIVSVPCDGRWYWVQFDAVVRAGTFEPGKVTFDGLQFGVTNEVTGDFEGAHGKVSTARLRLAG
jgi:hypothetical protein